MSHARICIISHNAYGALRGGSGGHIGGAERQTSLMARWFAAHGHETSLITWDEGQPDGELVAGVRVWKVCPPKAGWPGLRFFHPRLSGLHAAMRRAGAEVYYHNSAEAVTGLAARWCRQHRRKFVYSAAAELACDIRLPLMQKFHERALYKQGVRLADVRVVQTRRQQELLREGWGLSSAVLAMPCPGPEEKDFQFPTPPRRPRVVWAGRIDANKRLEWLLDVASRMPAVQFEIAAASNASFEMTSRLAGRAGTLPNVIWRGAVPREMMPEFYRGATCLCCTSMHEGFPNIFIEAWSHGIPVVTTFDPDGLAARLGLGFSAPDVAGLAGAIEKLCADRDLWSAASRHARDYFLQHHQVDRAMERFQSEFNRLLRSDIARQESSPASPDAVPADSAAVR